MKRPLGSLWARGVAWVIAAALIGAMASYAWVLSQFRWDAYLLQAQTKGFLLYESIVQDTPPPEGITLTPLTSIDKALADNNAFGQLARRTGAAYVTNFSIHQPRAGEYSGNVLKLVVTSPKLQYRVSDIASGAYSGPAATMGNLTRLLATYCSEPILYANFDDHGWMSVQGHTVWDCEAAPSDYRLPAAFLAVVALALLVGYISETSSHFRTFAAVLRDRRRFGGPETYSSEGPDELRETIAAVNAHLEQEREALSKRALVLSGVSHDLGTPATRLRLRTALIDDPDLRERLEADVDRMTQMIESVLTYTRAELSHEEPRQLSLSSLVEALVADYQDMGQPVELAAQTPREVETGGSMFGGRSRKITLPLERRMLVMARPVLLQRALSNLIDNALKYGRRAHVAVFATSSTATITVEDEGGEASVADVTDLIGPFKRGRNAAAIDGFGLGLTIVATIAEQHGGALRFEQGAKGLRAVLTLERF